MLKAASVYKKSRVKIPVNIWFLSPWTGELRVFKTKKKAELAARKENGLVYLYVGAAAINRYYKVIEGCC